MFGTKFMLLIYSCQEDEKILRSAADQADGAGAVYA